jgi:hypothetical protein
LPISYQFHWSAAKKSWWPFTKPTKRLLVLLFTSKRYHVPFFPNAFHGFHIVVTILDGSSHLVSWLQPIITLGGLSLLLPLATCL